LSLKITARDSADRPLLEWNFTATGAHEVDVPSRDLGTQGRALLRVAGRKSGENRWVRAVYKAGTVTISSIGRVLHVLWLEVTGLLFLVLALVGGGAAVRQYHRYTAGTAGLGRTVLASAFALGFAYFGVSSFWRSRRRS
jgi:hypothetical protein